VIIRAAACALLLALAVGWVTYDRAWLHGGAHPLRYHVETLRHFEPREPQTRVTAAGTEERVLITTGPRSSTGYSLEIERAEVERGRVYIVVREIAEPGRAKITYPYRLLVFPKLDKPVHVHWEGRT
jgi:hypothetical protein